MSLEDNMLGEPRNLRSWTGLQALTLPATADYINDILKETEVLSMVTRNLFLSEYAGSRLPCKVDSYEEWCLLGCYAMWLL
jgi:hypothetical protein